MKRFRESEAGNALILAFITIIALAGTSAALLSTSVYRSKEATMGRDYQKVLYVAEAGISVSIAEIMAQHDQDSDGLGNVAGSFDSGQYAVAATNLGGDVWRLRSAATHGEYSRGVEVVIDRKVSSPFTSLAFGGTSLSVGGTCMCDSYDSDHGTYASQVSGSHANENGDVASNGDISAGGNATVYGDATPGEGDTTTVGGSAYVDGSTAPASADRELDPYTYSPVGTSAGQLNSSTTLASGTYRYSDIKYVSSDTLTVGVNPGDVVTVYIDGQISLSANSKILITSGAKCIMHQGTGKASFTGQGVVNTSQIPANFLFFSATTYEVKFAGGSDFYGAAYAPNADLKLAGNSAFYGAAVGNTVDISSTADLHYDEALARLDLDPTPSYQVKAWLEYKP
jgi:hypothetical protein